MSNDYAMYPDEIERAEAAPRLKLKTYEELEAELDTFRDASLLLTGKLEDAEAELAALRRTVANMEYERNNQLPNYGIYAAGSFIKLLRKKLDEDRLCYHDAIDYCIQNELEWVVPRKEESSGE